MKKYISLKLAGNVLLVAAALAVILQILVIFNIIPFEILWGSTVEGESILKIELIALFISFLFASAIAVKVGYIKTVKFKEWIDLFFWIIFLYFIFNALGNLTTGFTLEKFILSGVSVLLGFFTYRLVIEK